MKNNNSNLLVLVIIMLVNALSYGTIIPLLYPYAQRFGLNATGLSFLFTSFSLAQFIATPIIGRLSDKFGRKPLLILSIFGTSISLFVFSIAKSVQVLFIARVIDEITGGNVSVAQAAISDTTKPQDRAKSFGLLGAAFGFGFTFGPAIGGVFSKINISAPFQFASLLALFGTLMSIFMLKETNSKKQKSVEFENLFDFQGLRRALFEPITGGILLVSFLSLIAQNARIISFQSHMVDSLHLNTFTIGLIFTVMGIVNIIMQGILIRFILNKARNDILVLKFGILIPAVVMLFLSLQSGFYFFVTVMLIFNAFFAFSQPVLTGLISKRTKTEDQGGILGLNQAYTSLSQIIGPLLAGFLIRYSISFVFVAVSVILILSFISTSQIKPISQKLDI